MTVLVVAVSARMLAQLGRRDGFSVVAYDRFGDADLRACCDGRSIAHDLGGVGRMADLVALADDEPARDVVYGAGLEDRPELIARLARGRRVLGTPPAALAGVRDPACLAQDVRDAGAGYPRTMDHADDDATGATRWLRKPRHGGGGRGVAHWRGGRLRRGHLLQEYRPGTPCSAVVLAAGGRSVVLGVTEQLVGDRRLGARGFTWCGNVTPPRRPEGERAELHGRLSAVATTLAARHDLRGIFGIDAIWDGTQAWVHEVNPRPPAGLEVVDLVRGGGSFAAHVAACADGTVEAAGAAGRAAAARVAAAPPLAPAPPLAAAKLVVFARHPVVAPEPGWWPAAARDVPQPGERIAAGAPICTLVAGGEEPGALVEALMAQAARLHAALPVPTLEPAGA